MFSLASKLLSTIASPAFEKSYERVCSIWDATDELHKLERSITTIQAVLLDAEKREEAAVKDWAHRVRGVLYDAEDLFDEVATDDLLEKQIKGNKHLKKVFETLKCCLGGVFFHGLDRCCLWAGPIQETPFVVDPTIAPKTICILSAHGEEVSGSFEWCK